MKTFAKRLRYLRNLNNKTQQQLADYLNVGKSTISNYETGYSSPDIETLKKLSEIFNVSTDYLLGESDIRTPRNKISHALEDDPELSEFWNELSKREDLQLLFKQTRDLSPKDIKQIIRIIKAIEDEESREY